MGFVGYSFFLSILSKAGLRIMYLNREERQLAHSCWIKRLTDISSELRNQETPSFGKRSRRKVM